MLVCRATKSVQGGGERTQGIQHIFRYFDSTTIIAQNKIKCPSFVVMW